MIKIRKIKSKKSKSKVAKGSDKSAVTAAVEYLFEKEYSQNNIPKHKENYKNYLGEGVWFGKLSKSFGIYGKTVEKSDFDELSRSINPKTKEKIGKATGRSFIEILFNCPKDYSLIALLDSENGATLREHFDECVQKTMELIESETVARLNNRNDLTKAPSIAYAAFVHETSRPTQDKSGSTIRPDPNIHVHALEFNAAEDEDGKLRAIENFKYFKNMIFYGTYFRSLLSQKLIELGYEIVPHDEVLSSEDIKGKEKKETIKSFEVKQFTNEQRLMFSKRKSDIDYLALKYGVNDAHSRDNLAQHYKNHKVKYDRDELREIWLSDAKLVGIDQNFFNSLRTYNRKSIANNIKSDEDLVRSAVKISKNGPVIYHRILMQKLCEYSQYVPINPLQKLEQLVSDGYLKRTSQYYFKPGFPLNQVSKNEQAFYSRKENSKQSFIGFYLLKNKSFLIEVELDKKYAVKETGDMQHIPVKLDTNYQSTHQPAQQVASKTTAITSTGSSIESLYQSLESLQYSLRNPKISVDEAARIRAKIEAIRMQIEELEKKKKNEHHI